MEDNLTVSGPTTCEINENKRKLDIRRRIKIMEDTTSYRMLIHAIINTGWKVFLKKKSKFNDEEIIVLLKSVYKTKQSAKKHVNAFRAMIKQHRKKMRADVKIYMKNQNIILYPPNHIIHTHNKLFPFLDTKIYDIFKPDTFPRNIPNCFLYEATQFMNSDVLCDTKAAKKYVYYLKKQSVKWLAEKLLPDKFHRHIIYGNNINQTLVRTVKVENITMDELITEIDVRYRDIQYELGIFRESDEEMFIDECKSSEEDNDVEKYLYQGENIVLEYNENGNSSTEQRTNSRSWQLKDYV